MGNEWQSSDRQKLLKAVSKIVAHVQGPRKAG